MSKYFSLDLKTTFYSAKIDEPICDFCDGHSMTWVQHSSEKGEHGEYLYLLCSWHHKHMTEKGWDPEPDSSRVLRILDDKEEDWLEFDQSNTFEPILLK